jgi:hypothetical protein
VVQSGLRPGDRVIIEGRERVRVGDKAIAHAITQPPTAAAGSAEAIPEPASPAKPDISHSSGPSAGPSRE